MRAWWSILLLGLTVFAKNCDRLGTLLYEDLGCAPIYASPKACPVGYKCPDLGTPDSHCRFRGKSYEPEEALPNTGIPCQNACRCLKHDNSTHVACGMWACDEIFWNNGNCRFTYSFDQCCAKGKICPPFDNLHTCTVNGYQYHEGQMFLPTSKCYDCICRKGFSGKMKKPFCRRRSCGVQLGSAARNLRNYCAPFYGRVGKNDALCCPADWICSDGSEVSRGSARRERTRETCRFGDKVLNVGEVIEKTFFTRFSHETRLEKVHCECVLPPLLTCKENNNAPI